MLAESPRPLAAPAAAAAAAAPLGSERGSTYRQILKSTALIGGSSLVNVAVGVLRTKAMAMLLGPAGFGLMGVFTSIADLTRSLAEMGINSSGVRQIAEAAGTGDQQRIARTVVVLRRTAVLLGLIGALLLLLFARPISTFTFGTDTQAGAVALLSAAVFLRLVSDGQCALLQGMRRIPDLARIGVAGSLLGTLAGVPIVYWLREDGVVPALVAVAAGTTLTSWWYVRRVAVVPCRVTMPEMRQEAASLLQLGAAFMASGLLMMGAAYVVRLIVLRESGLAAAGFYQAAWTLGGLYVGFVLQAMGADFYPRLVAAIEQPDDANRLVNEQAQVSLLLAGPGVIATLTLAPAVVALLYSQEFSQAVGLLRWLCLGMALRVLTWPMGYIIVARNRRVLFFGSELAWTVVNVALSWVCVKAFGLDGAGIAFFGSYVFHGVLVYAVSRQLTRFAFTPAVRNAALLYVASIGAVFVSFQTLPTVWAMAIGLLLTSAATVFSVRALYRIAGLENAPRSVLRIFNKLGFAR